MPSRSPTERSPLLSPVPEPPSDPIPPVAESAEEDVASQSVTKLRSIGLMISLGILVFLQATNFSILTTTQSTIAEDLDAFAEASWFTSAYLIAMSSVSPLAGRLSQVFSPRYCILVAAVVFSIGSLVTSQAPRLSVFLVGRVITGIGAAGRGMFWLQTPLTFIAGTAAFMCIPSSLHSGNADSDSKSLKHKLLHIDYAGAILLTSALVTLLTGLSSPQILYIPIILSLLLLLLFTLNETYLASDPVIPLALLRSRGALLTCLAQLGAMMARWLVLFYTPVYALAVRGWAPTSAGSILIPTNAGFATGGLLAGALHIRRAGSFYTATLVSFAFFPVTLLVLAQLSTGDSPAAAVVAATFANGVAAGAFLNYTLAHMLHLTPVGEHPVATSLLATFRGFAGSFGSAIGGGIFVRILKGSLESGFEGEGLLGREGLIRRLLGQPALVRTLEGAEKEVARQGYVDAIRGLFIAGVGLSTVMILVQAGTGWKGASEKKVQERDENE
ncbi:MAG: hypothetical protein MMC23_002527 [Stictis urceolatum]|nr:hypothetical protein [Stictis urceolata]